MALEKTNATSGFPRTILSLFDYSGNWSRPYRDNGYDVIQIDIKSGGDVRTLDTSELPAIHGILAAPPCTDFSSSGARWWAAKDADGRTLESLALVDRTLELVRELAPQWWALENPVGRLKTLRPELGKPFYFQPYWYGNAYSKKTCLWGKFNSDLSRKEVEPVMYERGGKKGSWFWACLGGSSERTKELRSLTPPGFADAFFQANP